jgi:hypothetical protein
MNVPRALSTAAAAAIFYLFAGTAGAQDYEPPPPPPPRERGGDFEMPPWSVRLDPFNWLLEGRLGLELEVGLLEFMTFELVPVFVVNDQPPTLNLSGVEDTLRQESNGLGAMSGASLGLGFWLQGRVLRGTVLRAIFQNQGYTYKTVDSGGTIDRFSHTDRVLMGMIGSHSRFGAFTIAGGIGLGVDLNKEERCFDRGNDFTSAGTLRSSAPSGRNCGEQQIAVDRTGGVADVGGFLYPAVLEGRISLGVSFD